MAGAAVGPLSVAVGKTLVAPLLGYALGTLGVCDPTAGKGLNQYLTWVAFPAVVFHGLATMDLRKLSWPVYSTIVVPKLLAAVVMVVIVLLLSRAPLGARLKKAGILAMFVSMTNDVAFGLPIIQGVYPDFASYLYLPQQHIVFNPLAFILLELGVSWDAEPAADDAKRLPAPLRVLGNVLSNHVLVVSFVGLACNAATGGRLPVFLDDATAFIAQSFAAGALFSIGLSMVGKASLLQGRGLIWPAVATLIKIVFTSNIARYYAVLIEPSWVTLHNFAYVYGCLPVGVPCFLFAAQYDAFPEVVAGGIILALVLSGPAIALAVVYSDLGTCMNNLVAMEQLLNGVSGIAALLLLPVLLGRRVYRDLPESLVLHLTLCILANAAGYQLCASLFCPDAFGPLRRRPPLPYLVHQFFRQQVEVAYVAVAVSVAVEATLGLGQARRLVTYHLLAAWVVPFGFVALLTLADAVRSPTPSCWISYGLFQTVVEAALLTLEAALVLAAFVLVLRAKPREGALEPLTGGPPGPAAPGGRAWVDPHLMFRICLLLAYFLIFAGFKLTWLGYSAFQDSEREPVEMLQRLLLAILTHGHGVVVAVLFGLASEDSQDWVALVAAQVRQALRRALFRAEAPSERAPLRGADDDRLLALVDAAAAPEAGLLANRVCGLHMYYHVVEGSALVAWMLRTGRAGSHAEALATGQALVDAGLLYHVALEHAFHDRAALCYRLDRGVRERVRRRTRSRFEEAALAPTSAAAADPDRPPDTAHTLSTALLAGVVDRALADP